jgi:calcium-independent phospholipase A2-gamma
MPDLSSFLLIFLSTAVHTILKDLLPRSTYYRFNPELTEDIAIDESKPEKLEQLIQDADNYIRNNHELLKLAAASLTADKQPHQRAEEWVRSQWNKAQSRFTPLRTSR